MTTQHKGQGGHPRGPKSWAEAEKQLDAVVDKRIREGEGKGLNAICSKHHYWGPWLLMRGCDTDTGARPTSLPTYLSPDIMIESNDPLHLGRAIPGEPNYIWARIWNLHRFQAAPVKLDFGWANPAVGLGPGFVNPFAPNQPSDWTIVPALSAVWVKCQTPWVPEFLNGGHECLFVNCDCYTLDPLILPWQPALDRHAGQRNITVAPVPPGGMFKLNLELNNIFPNASLATLSFRTAHLALTRTFEGRFAFNDAVGLLVAHGMTRPPLTAMARRRAAIRGTRPLSVWRPPECCDDQPPPDCCKDRDNTKNKAVAEINRPGAGVTVVAEIAERVTIGYFPDADAYFGNLLLARGGTPATPAGPPTMPLREIQMRAFERRHVSLEIGVPAAARPGEFIVCHVTQTNDGFELGGYSIVIRVTKEEHKRR